MDLLLRTVETELTKGFIQWGDMGSYGFQMGCSGYSVKRRNKNKIGRGRSYGGGPSERSWDIVWVCGRRWLEGEEGKVTFNFGCVSRVLGCWRAIYMLLRECKLAELEQKME